MNDHSDLENEIDRLSDEKNELLRQNSILRAALVKVADWLEAYPAGQEQANLIRTTLWNSATPEQRNAPFVEKAKLCYKCGRQEASKNFAVCPACYKDPVEE